MDIEAIDLLFIDDMIVSLLNDLCLFRVCLNVLFVVVVDRELLIVLL